MCISVLDNDYIRNAFCARRRGGGDERRKTLLLDYWTLVCEARIDDYQLRRRRAGPSAASDIHYNAGWEINFAN